MKTVTSTDGTTIAHERSEERPPVVLIGGGLAERSTYAELADLLPQDFTVFDYDRRGREVPVGRGLT
jgi:pimeloyl-ACP methyl ester carboxylesterase